MAYQFKHFERLAGEGATLTLWGYTTEDAPAVVAGSGYFNAAAGMLRVGDHIMVNQLDAGGALVAAGTIVVNSIAAGVVDCTDPTSLTVTDAG